MGKNKILKPKTFKPSKHMVAKAKLNYLRNEHRNISRQLLNAERWLPLEQMSDSAITLDSFVKRLSGRQQTLMKQIQKLQSEIASTRPKFLRDMQVTDRPGLPGILPDPLDPRFREAIMFGRVIGDRLDFHRKFTAFSPRCESKQGFATLKAVHDSDVIGPSQSSSSVQAGFYNYTLPGQLRVSFLDNSITSPYGGDWFKTQRILDFEFPAAPCDGRLTLRYAGYLTTTPSIYYSGSVSSFVRSMIHISGDGIDPLVDTTYWGLEAYTGVNTDSGEDPFDDVAPVSDPFQIGFRVINVRKGDVALFHYSIENSMYVFSGQASFFGSGPDIAEAVFLQPIGIQSEEFGIYWEFEPTPQP